MKSPEEKKAEVLIADNRKAHFDYHVLETFEAGIMLLGTISPAAPAGTSRFARSSPFIAVFFITIGSMVAWSHACCRRLSRSGSPAGSCCACPRRCERPCPAHLSVTCEIA